MEVIFDMKVNFKRFFRGMIAMLSIFTVMIASIPVYANEETLNVDFCSRYVTVNDQKMHVVLLRNSQILFQFLHCCPQIMFRTCQLGKLDTAIN